MTTNNGKNYYSFLEKLADGCEEAMEVAEGAPCKSVPRLLTVTYTSENANYRPVPRTEKHEEIYKMTIEEDAPPKQCNPIMRFKNWFSGIFGYKKKPVPRPRQLDALEMLEDTVVNNDAGNPGNTGNTGKTGNPGKTSSVSASNDIVEVHHDADYEDRL